QRLRLERLFLSERAWPVTTWQERYLDHPLVSGLTKRLIWSFEDAGDVQLGLWHDGHFVDCRGNRLPDARAETIVRFWHPIGCDPAIVLAWRVWLEERGVVQPFKQAHREVYILTDAELGTATCSNRFAAHILRQHIFNALCRERGWRYHLM